MDVYRCVYPYNSNRFSTFQMCRKGAVAHRNRRAFNFNVNKLRPEHLPRI